MTITGSVINKNQVDSSGTAMGGGIFCADAVLSLTNCTVNGNQANGAQRRWAVGSLAIAASCR